MAGLRSTNLRVHIRQTANACGHSRGIAVMFRGRSTGLAVAAALMAAGPAFACDTVDDVVRETRGQMSKVTVISEEGALSRALARMLGNADEVQTAETL